ncbi:hypothetical protein HY502_02830 [Candidatus Woesebacteria bacterium]|nr:hypothetical protein [Candidatus Woesebacteria bacterium]
MILLLLGGTHVSNKRWIERVSTSFQDKPYSNQILYYDHWQSGNETIDFQKELNKLLKLTANLKNYLIFAKSVGVLLVLKAVYQGKLDPKRCVFVGTPVFWAHDRGYDVDKWLRGFSVPTLFIQESQDPFIEATGLKKKLKGLNVKNYQFEEVPGNTHNYSHIAKIRKLSSFLFS